MIEFEDEHITHYGSLIDPNSTWLESLLLRFTSTRKQGAKTTAPRFMASLNGASFVKAYISGLSGVLQVTNSVNSCFLPKIDEVFGINL